MGSLVTIMRSWRAAAALLVLACSALAGCTSSVAVSATANVPAQYSHVYVTVAEVWVNTSATAAPEDAGWLKFPLSSPFTFDLVSLTSGTLSEFASKLPLPPATYNQLRLVLSDTSATLTNAAETAGAQFNNEVDYFDSTGTAQQLPLAVPNAAQGVGIPFQLKVLTPSTALLAALGSASAATTSSNNTCTSTEASLNGCTTTPTTTTTTPTTTTSTTTSTTTGSSATDLNTAITASASVVFNAASDIAPFRFSDKPGYVLSPTLTGQDLANAGTIRGQIGITAIVSDTNIGRPDIQVTAEKPNADGTRNVPVMSAPVSSDGTFILYPFPTDSAAPTTYDLVIHGPNVQTVIIKAVPIASGTPSTATTASLSNLVLAAATPYPVNVDAASPVAPRGARVAFYQTISGSSEIPYVIEERPVDPLSGLFADNRSLATGNIAFGTYSSGAVTLSTGAPAEGTGAYRVAASAPVYGDGTFGATVAPGTDTTTAVTFTGPTVNVPSSATSGTVTATLTVSAPGRYDKGALVVTHEGAIVSVTALDSLLVQATGTLTVSNIPGGSTSGVYYAEVWVWNSNDPTGTFSRQPGTTGVDLRSSPAGTLALTIS